ncbi:hypothetical protein [Paenibacillus flagellatus]|uniref:Preprotein translocase subunit Tim44 n=1 Tax=Paenibacillus flagellatus TaxID=2211139 RepID=A0A2V5JX31_9BACL|nr:hypothetical protein [Paenibacillus flagellatus]PYI51389.1 hypothetical protein DLM86_25560 [Paenibacillus flagellatus]
MKRLLTALLAATLLFGCSTPIVRGETADAVQEEGDESGTLHPLKRGSYRSPPRTYNPGAGAGTGNVNRTTPARPDNAARTPTAPRTTPAPRTGFGGFLGGMFGGLALGTILGSLFNPFAGFSLGFPVLSLFSFVIWIAVILVIVRLFRRRRPH